MPSALGLPTNVVRPVSLLVGASVGLLLGACSFVGDAPELTVAEQLEKLSGRPLTQIELDDQLELADLLCNLDQKVLNELWGQLDARQTEFQDFVFGQRCPERMELYQAARPSMGEVPEAQQTTTTETTTTTATRPSSTRPKPSQGPTDPRTTPTTPATPSSTRQTTTTKPTTTRSVPSSTRQTTTTSPSTTRSTAGPATGDSVTPRSTTTTNQSTVF